MSERELERKRGIEGVDSEREGGSESDREREGGERERGGGIGSERERREQTTRQAYEQRMTDQPETEACY